MTQQMRARNWCFTSYNTSMKLEDFKENLKNLNYIIYQKEKCPSTKKLHLQGYMEFTNPCTIKSIKKHLDDEKIHLESRKGTQEDAIKYCSKEESRVAGPFEWGEPKSQGKRTDLDDVTDKLKEGKSLKEIAYDNSSTFVKFHKGLEKFKFIIDNENSKKLRKIETTVLIGKSGCGKTSQVYNENNIEDIYSLSMFNPLWFDGYAGEKVLLIDDFYGEINYHMLLKILDRYPLQLPIKGASTYAAWTKIYITSNKSPEEWYPNHDFEDGLKRRITTLKRMGWD